MYEEAARLRGLTPPRTHPLASVTWLGPAASNPALAHRVGGDPAHLAESRRWIEAAVRLPHWGKAHMPDHDLDAGWLLHHLSLAHRWIGDDLPDGLRALLRYKLLLQGRRMYEFAVASEGGWWSSSYWQNHNWICYAGLATAGYVLGKEEWTERAKENLGTVLDLMPEDGSHAEGVVYWRYGVPFLAIHLDLLQEAEGIDWWDRGGFLSRTFHYRLHQTAPGFARNVDHGDCHDRRSGHSAALYYRLAAQYGIPEAQWMGDLASGELLWQEASESGVRPGILPEAISNTSGTTRPCRHAAHRDPGVLPGSGAARGAYGMGRRCHVRLVQGESGRRSQGVGDICEAPGRAGLGDPQPGAPSPGLRFLRDGLAG